MPTKGFSIKPLKNKLLEGEQKATEKTGAHHQRARSTQILSGPFLKVCAESTNLLPIRTLKVPEQKESHKPPEEFGPVFGGPSANVQGPQ